MGNVVINCKKCKRIFQKVSGELCAACIQLEEEQFKLLYRTLQQSAPQGGVSIEELSAEVGIAVEDIDRFYREGRLSTAGIFLKLQCQACGVMTVESERRGRYCIKCSELAATKAGVEVRSRQEIEKGEAREALRQQQLAMLKKNQPAAASARKFGSGGRYRP